MEEKEQIESKTGEIKETEKVEVESTPKTEETMPKPNTKKNKKLIYGIVVAIAVIAVCIGAYVYSEKQHKQEILDSIQVTFVDELTVEYGTKDFDFNSLIKEKSGEVILPEQIDTMKVGEIEVIYKVEKEGVTKEFPIKLNVTDTKAPEIKIKEDIVTIAYGKEYNIKDNIESVKDPVDGDVPYSDKAGESNYYTVEGKVDTSKAGDYKITINAVDKNKNKSEKTYTVHVEEEEVEQPVYNPSNGGNNTNTGGSGYNPPVNNGGNSSSSNSTTTCVSNGSYSPVGNSGMLFNSLDAANNYANKQIMDKSSPWYMKSFVGTTCSDNCGNQMWTVEFY